MTTKNPFPGMNPFFEQRWQDAHTMLIAYIRDSLQEQLPADLVAGAEERLVTVGASEKPGTLRPDVRITQPWELKDEATMTTPQRVRAATATMPTFVLMDEPIERWVEIRDADGRLISVIELLSPSNKIDASAR